MAPFNPTRSDSAIDIRSMRKRITKIPKQLDSTLGNLKLKVKSSLEGGRLSQDGRGETTAVQVDAPPRLPRILSESIQPKSGDKSDHKVEGSSSQEASSPATVSLVKDPLTQLSRVHSSASTKSKASSSNKSHKSDKSSHKSHKSKASTEVVPVPTFDAPAPAGKDLSDDEDSDDEIDLNEHAFDHPSTYVEQPWIWLPRDRLGLSEILVNELRDIGVDASDTGAVMDKKGVVEVTRNPPDEEWVGGHDD